MSRISKIYLAGRWSMRDELTAHAAVLKDTLGLTVTSRWLTDPEHRMKIDDSTDMAYNQTLASHDIYDIKEADTLIYFGPGGTRGGCHVEFGMALALKKRLFWVGPRTHVFSYLSEVEQFETWAECLAFLRGISDGERGAEPKWIPGDMRSER